MALRASSAPAILCAVLDCEALGREPRDFAARLFQAGVDWIQLRDRSVEGETLLRVARDLVAARDALGSSRQIVVNKRLDIALASGADGVHLGVDALTVSEVDRLRPKAFSIGRSLHSVAEVETEAQPSLDYAHLAPIWDPRSKPASRPPLGTDVLSKACRRGLPILAQGGIDPERAAAALRAGAAGVAVTGLIDLRALDPFDPVRRLRSALDRAQGVESRPLEMRSACNRGADG